MRGENLKMSPKDKLEKVLRKHFGSEAPEAVEAIVEYVQSVVGQLQTLLDASRFGVTTPPLYPQPQTGQVSFSGGGSALTKQLISDHPEQVDDPAPERSSPMRHGW